MRNILYAGQRKEVGKLFELLLRQPDRVFTNASSREEIIKQARMATVDLLILDPEIGSPEHCFNILAALKEAEKTAAIPIILLTDPARDSDEELRLVQVVDAQIAEPFNPGEIKSVAEQFI